MITRFSHSTIWVLDQAAAKEFYTKTLGFVVRDEVTTDFFSWLTVSPPDQADIRLVLMEPGSPAHDPETEAQIRSLIAKGALGGGVFDTDDCRKTYEQLSAAGVVFTQEPAERPYGVEAVFRDDSGNWFSLTERRGWDPEKPFA
ncbi:catechol 2,3-dioxygenase-like lactoylglutathione lyase family enzyme [Kibdelosporangium banguiense]|uniref:Catechol 2,3-dioxygenase-like lactoylglutathione lyase family enzyme n=1 Tax=Kibdelosporangium banguiense TaxID=1365924 RepID=A0ABS4TJ86_9PSEU|nr:VOC family protein [Kibdelosporangium banguiense]MBP2324482.1 catechol 2,3-dioxygenase-like lactoylglutathione lyase family enzyme [Kibdelosporangium banguiense]